MVSSVGRWAHWHDARVLSGKTRGGKGEKTMKNRTKRLFRKVAGTVMSGALALSTFGSVFSGPLVMAKAADGYTVTETGKGTYFQITRGGGTNDWNVPLYTDSDGDAVFCVEYEYKGPASDGYEETDPEGMFLSEGARNGVAAILREYNEGTATSGLSEEAAETTAAVAIKKFLADEGEFGSGSGYGLSSMIKEKAGCEDEWNAMNSLVATAKANMGNDGTSQLSISRDSSHDAISGNALTYGYSINSDAADYDISISGYDGAVVSKNDGWFTVTIGADNTSDIIIKAKGTVKGNGALFLAPSGNDSLQTMVKYGSSTKYSEDEATIMPGAAEEPETPEPSTGSIKVKKTDKDTGEALRNALFGVYLDSNCSSDQYLGQLITDENGEATMSGLPAGTYYVMEQAAPARYTIDDTSVHAVSVTEDNTSVVSFTDTKLVAALQWNKTSATNGRMVSGARFGVYDLTKVKDNSSLTSTLAAMFDASGMGADGLDDGDKAVVMLEELIASGSDLPDGHTASEFLFQEVVSDENGLCTTDRDRSNELVPGHEYAVLELAPAEGYARSEDVCFFTFGTRDYDSGMEAAMTVLASFEGKWSNFEKPGRISVTKLDSETGLPVDGATYGIYTDKACTIPAHYVEYDETANTVCIDNSKVPSAGSEKVQYNASYALYSTANATVQGNYTSGWLMAGTYYLKEVKAPIGYELSDEVQAVTVSKGSHPSLTFSNNPVKGTVIVSKTDSTDSSVFVEGATYGLYNSAKAQVATFAATNEYGKARISNLSLGNYYVKELSAPEGYELDSEYHAVSTASAEPVTANVSDAPVGKTTTVPSETPTKTPAETPATVVPETITVETPDDSDDGDDTTPYFKVIKINPECEQLAGATLQVYDQAGQLVDQWVSDGTDHVVENVTLGGTYLLHELAAPAGYELASDVIFTLPLTMDEVMVITMVDYARPSMVINKVDEEGNQVSGATLAIYDMDGNEVATWVTEGHGVTVEGLVSGQSYLLRELEAPDGYAQAEDILFTAADGASVDMVDYVVVQTGDAGHVALFITLMGLFSAAFVLVVKKKNSLI